MDKYTQSSQLYTHIHKLKHKNIVAINVNYMNLYKVQFSLFNRKSVYCFLVLQIVQDSQTKSWKKENNKSLTHNGNAS